MVGGSGCLGREIVDHAVRKGHEVTATFNSGPGTIAGADWTRLDIRHRTDVRELVNTSRPQVIVNTAFVPDDWSVTATGAAHVALAAADALAHLVHVSSDAVFSGLADVYDEDAVPDPITPYGAAKAAAEVAVRAIVPAAAVVRTSLIIGDRGETPHERFVHSLLHAPDSGVLFSDEIRCPVHVADLAGAIHELTQSGASGVQHVAGADAISRYELGMLIAQRDGLDGVTLQSARRAESSLPGALDVQLACARTRGGLETRLRGAREFLA